MQRPTAFTYSLGAALLFTVLPLWSATHLPFVDIPQHLHLIHVLGHLDDPSTIYPEIFKARGQITPYLGYYDAVWLLSKVFSIYTANAIFLSIVAILTPLSVRSLLRALRSNEWLCLLACPLFYGDNIYWGFINYCASLPLLIFAMAWFIDVLQEPADPKYKRELALAVMLVAVQLMHIQAFFFAGVALPVLLILTSSDKSRRIRAIVAALPAALMFASYSIGRLGEKPDIAPGAPWKAWGPIFSAANLSFYPWRDNWNKLEELLANGFRDGDEKHVVTYLLILGAAALVGSFIWKPVEPWGKPQERARGPLLALLALGMFLFLPFDIRGYIYYVNYRFAELFALLLVAALPFPSHAQARNIWIGAAVLVNVWYGAMLQRNFGQFELEANAIDTVSAKVGAKPKIMALSYDTASKVVTHPAYLHFACYPAMEHGGMTSFSFASTPHSPIAYQGAPPPAPTSEWRADQFDYPAYGNYYDHYLVRGNVPPNYVFRGHQAEVQVAGQSGPFTLYRR